MLCFQCGTKVKGNAEKCTNCNAVLKVNKKLELSSSRGLRISQEMKAIRLDKQLFPPGELVDERYDLAEMIGRGPFGEVYRAFDTDIKSDVAVKIFDKDLLDRVDAEERFIEMTGNARRVDHPNMARIHGSGIHKAHPWVAMQLLEGLSLRKILDLRKTKGEKFELSELDSVLSQIVAALKADKGHGNLKPENIVFLPDVLKLTDSYISRSFNEQSLKDRLKGSKYLAPELLDAFKPTAQSDVYSFGVIVGEMVFGSDYKPTPEGKFGQLALIDEVLAQATSFEPRTRYDHVGLLADALDNAIERKRKATPPPLQEMGSPPPPPNSSAEMVAVSSDDLPIIGEDIPTVEYDRKIDKEIQNYIQTTEVKRDKDLPTPPKSTHVADTVEEPRERSQTAAMPLPKEVSVPKGKAVVKKDEKGFPFLWIAALVFLGVMVAMWASQKTELVELGNEDKAEKSEVEKSKKSEKTEKVEPKKELVKDETPKVEIAKITPEVTTNTNSNFISGITINKDVDSNTLKPEEKENAKTEVVKEDEKKAKETIASETIASETIASETIASESKSESKKDIVEVPPGTECPKGHVLKKRKWGNYCIARYEYPGGGRPKTRVSWFAANKLCKAKGQRLCKTKEWRSACGSKYPYGSKFDANKCNSVDEDGFDRSIARSGAFKKCRKGGVYDLVGNVHEWTMEQRIAGGGFESDESVATCRYSSSKSPGSSSSYIGFRCCADPK